jgi:integrase/recombinase XerD
MAPDDLHPLLDSWLLHLRAERMSPQTVSSCGEGVWKFLSWCRERGTSSTLDRPTVNAFISDLLEGGAEATTARARGTAQNTSLSASIGCHLTAEAKKRGAPSSTANR